MEFQTLKKSHLKRNILIGVVVVAVISAIVLNFTRARYRVTQSIPLVSGTINYIPYDFKVMAMYQESDTGEYVEIDAMPNSGYTINEEASYCTLDNVNKDNEAVLYTNDSGEHVIAGLKKNSKCYLYFDEKPLASVTILAGKDIQERTDFSTVLSTDTNGIIYQEQTSDGTTYYFAGNPSDNWVFFGGFYWRIIRINEDGSIRMIYNGTTTDQTGSGTQLADLNAFNSVPAHNRFVGYMYGEDSDNYADTHANINNSTIKTALDNWYLNNLMNYNQYIDGNAGFCGDRTPYSGSGIGSDATNYAAYNRLMNNMQPTFECSNSHDLFTTSESNQGNKALQYPIGLITADEVAYAGGVYGTNNTGYYLYTSSSYWTLSPSYFYSSEYGDQLRVFYVSTNGDLLPNNVYMPSFVRPVINLKADVTISSGNGTSSSPFVVN